MVLHVLLVLLLYCLLCNVGYRHQNLSHLNRTHNEKNRNKVNTFILNKKKHKQNNKQS